MELYIFNPDADMALANNTENYMPPVAAKQMATDLAMLPMWYAKPGGKVLAPSAYNADFLQQMKQLFPLQVDLLTEPELAEADATYSFQPWGWNLALRRRLLKTGLPENQLPSPEALDAYRTLAGRDTSIRLLQKLGKMEGCCGEAFKVTSLEECREYASRNPRCLFKSPWSGSGKGLWWCYNGLDEAAQNWCRKVLKELGMLVVSPIYDVCQDFAMEFCSDGKGKVTFVGYSLFETSRKGAYMGNTLAPTSEIRRIIERFFHRGFLPQVRTRLAKELAAAYGHSYTGYLGVDMMVCREATSGKYLLHPCVEVNLRMNMGVVSHLFSKRYLVAGRWAAFSVEYYPTNEALREAVERYSKENPLEVVDGKLRNGFLPLTPITPNSHYLAYVDTDRFQ
ncbi:MAG: hypothetical protein J6C87_09250 [Bacteroides sp.]|nr:hypothetical protein [Bacteroides sp.]